MWLSLPLFYAILEQLYMKTDRRKICKQQNITITLLFIAKILDIFRTIMLIFTYKQQKISISLIKNIEERSRANVRRITLVWLNKTLAIPALYNQNSS